MDNRPCCLDGVEGGAESEVDVVGETEEGGDGGGLEMEEVVPEVLRKITLKAAQRKEKRG